MSETPVNPWIHRFAFLTAALSMFPIVLGAMTTTQDAGMAFPDWPTSDGQGMFSYPWLRLIGDMGTNPDSYAKFLEHGHRLAGILIGLAAIGLAVVCSLKGSTKTLRFLGWGVLFAVIAQGILGGFRVELNERGLAMFHGLFASLVFSLMCITSTVSSKSWYKAEEFETKGTLNGLWFGSVAFFVFLLVQYALGGLIRHPLGTRSPVHEHLGFGVLALILVHVLLFSVLRTKNLWLRRAMRMLLIAVGIQVLLGLVTYAAKFGVPSMGIVAVAQSTGQVVSRTAHMVTGVLVVGASAVLAVRVGRMRKILKLQPATETTPAKDVAF
ncbi:COX15/CtaA family protein [Rubinisphaera brasiliensis]|uniref:COX15/CtaA family protein n=1 Tax=Rubinisphaera brasiliensis TaxID=119 RepID=UPI00145C56E0|nr:COX15/CtaA family protein [Rubinisphaera brasiliensis]